MRGMFGKPIRQRVDQIAADGDVALGEQLTDLAHRAQHRSVLVDMAIARREGGSSHPLILLFEMLL